ncbi:MAG: ABC transporter permease [Planctomycetota bacterium]|nr:ABC transporter permease [Planctomycetota bacterium]
MLRIKVFGILMLLLVLCGLLAITVPESFLTGNNIENLLRRTALYGVLGIGVAFVIITSGIDLSIGSVVCLAGCLLAMFLRVSHLPSDQTPVYAVAAAEKQLMLPANVSVVSPGDRIRYYGGRRAEAAVRTVVDVEQRSVELDGKAKTTTVVTVDQPFSKDDSLGYVARVFPVESSKPRNTQNGSLAEVTVMGQHPVRPRDQVVLIHATSGFKQLPISSVESAGSMTHMTLQGAFEQQLDSQWVALPLYRSQRMSIVMAVTLVLAIGAALGWIHGILITKIGLQPFVVTLCGLLFYRGISRWLVNDQPQGFGNEYDATLRVVATGKAMIAAGDDGGFKFGVPNPFFILLGVACLAAFFLGKTIWGRYMLALGRSRQAAEYSGINTGRMTIVAYVICTSLAALGGMLFALDANSVSPSSFGNFFELYAIAAAVLGGCSLRGGEGGILGVVIGTALMQVLYNLIVLMRISDTLQFAIIGAVILAGVIADESLKKWNVRRQLARRAADHS